MQIHAAQLTWPNRITLARLLLSPALILLGVLAYPRLYLLIFALLLLSDAIDGYLARYLHQQSQLGSQLDTAADVTLSGSVLLGGVLLWPDRMLTEAPLMIAIVALLAISGLLALAKFRKLPSYHTYSAKLSTTFLGIGIWLLLAGITPWIFRGAVGLLAFSALESACITFLLPHWQSDTHTLIQAWRGRKQHR